VKSVLTQEGKRQRQKKIDEATAQIINNPTNHSRPLMSPLQLDTAQFCVPPFLQCDDIDFLDEQQRRQFARSKPTPLEVQFHISKAESEISQRLMTGSPRADLLLTLIQFNIFRALVYNTHALGLDFAWLQEEAVSTFYGQSNTRDGPTSLYPTTLQYKVEHHPWIDLFPFPAMRDNMLRQGEDFDDSDLCYDLVELCHAPSERSGLIVWGEPWEPSNWEVTEQFASKWPWMLKGCFGLLHSTNFWRQQRGENEVVFDVMPFTP
jgi:hypothetical protein